MTAKELEKRLIAMQRECNENMNLLKRQYALEHNPVKIGDIITDHFHTIKVETMRVYGFPIPYMQYDGTKMTKKGVPAKRQPLFPDPVYQNNIVEINGNPYTYDKTGEELANLSEDEQ